MTAERWETFRSYLKSDAPPLAVVIGAGIHWLPKTDSKPELQPLQNQLASWPGLLNSLSESGSRHKNVSTTLLWEILAIERAGDSEKPARLRDLSLRRAVQERITKAEMKLWGDSEIHESPEVRPLRNLLAHPKVTDVISLNVDLTIERLLGVEDAKPTRRNHGTPPIPSSPRANADQLISAREAERSDGSTLRIWHPHGDRTDPEQNIFGIWAYRSGLEPLTSARGWLKAEERKRSADPDGIASMRRDVEEDPSNWLAIMMHRPLLFVGAGLSAEEWDLWFALVSRWRNFARSSNAGYEPRSWVLTTGEEHAHLPEDRFGRLEGAEWEEAWSRLDEALNASGCGSDEPTFRNGVAS
jgi:hypothetical protein